jgi:hypothetical protein
MLRLFRSVLLEYLTSFRVLIECGVAALVPYLVLRDTLDGDTILSTWALLTLVLSAYITSIITDLADQSSHLWRLPAMRSRDHYLNAYLLTAGCVSLLTYAVMVIATQIINPFAMPAWSTIIATWPTLLVLIATIIVLISLFSPLITQTWHRLSILLVITIPFAWNSLAHTIAFQRNGESLPIVDSITTILGIVIWPALHLYAVSIQPTYTWLTILFMALHVLLIGILLRLAQYIFRQKFIQITT